MYIQKAIDIQMALKTYKNFSKEIREACDIAINALEEIRQYRSIGTVEEFREAVERQNEKKPIWSPDCEECEKYGTDDCTNECTSAPTLKSVLICPTCKKCRVIDEHGHKCCPECGQCIDWSFDG